MKAFLAVLSGLTLVSAQTRYQCDLKNTDWNTPTGCLKLDSSSTNTYDVIDIRPCVGLTNTNCPATTKIAQDHEVACEAPTAPQEPLKDATVVPGMPCSSDAVCISGTCNMGYCQGVGSGENCATNGDNDCNPGLYCDTTQATPVCTALLGVGKTCAGTNQCAMNLGCTNKVCTAYYSLDNGETDTECGKITADFMGFPQPVGSPTNYSVFCKSGTCVANGGTCTYALHSSTALPVQCTVGEANQCATNNAANGETASITASTTCVNTSYNPQGQTYCAVEIGDEVYVTFINWVTGTLMPLLSGTNPYCHTSQRGINTDCLMRLGGKYLGNQYTVAKENADNYALYQGTEVCTVQVFLPLYFQAQQYNYFCDTAFQCAGNTTTFTNNVGCIQQTTYSDFNIRPCTDPINTVCPAVNIYQATKEVECVPAAGAPAPATNLLPGDLCMSNYQCLSNLCTNGMCEGVASGGLCPNGTSDCNPGLYCLQSSGKCGPLLTAGADTQCYESSDCVMDAGCNFDPTSGKGTCTTYYSVAKGGSVSDCGQSSFVPEYGANGIPQGSSTYVKYSALCKSGTCELKSGTAAGTYAGVCVSAYKSQGALPQTCNFGPTDCPMNNEDNAMTYGKCSCAQASTSKTRYCSLDFLDQPWVDFSTWAQTYFTNFTTYYPASCHSYRRAFDQLCMMKIGGVPRVMQFQEKWLLATNYPTIVNSANCTQQVYNSAYWTAYQYNRPYKPDDISSGVLLALAALLAY